MGKKLKRFYDNANKDLIRDMLDGHKIKYCLVSDDKILIYKAYTGYLIPVESLYLSTSKMLIGNNFLKGLELKNDYEIKPTGLYEKENSSMSIEFESIGDKKFKAYLNSYQFKPFEKCDRFTSAGELEMVYAYVGSEMVGVISPLKKCKKMNADFIKKGGV